MDQSATPIYLEQIRDIMSAYMNAGSPEAFQRNLSVLTTWQAAGRASEAAFISLSSLEWDPHYECIFAFMPQPKPSEIKQICFTAGVDRHCCWFTAFGDYLVTNKRVVDIDIDTDWLLPDMNEAPRPLP